MSNPENKKLKDLLNDSVSGEAFEREAREGFDLLSSDREALQLKQELDQKIKPLFAREKRGSALIYWMAAAMLLVMGLSVYFMLSGDPVQTDAGKLALAKPKQEDTDGGSEFKTKAAEFRPAQPATDAEQYVKETVRQPVAEPARPAAVPLASQADHVQPITPEMQPDIASADAAPSGTRDQENDLSGNSALSLAKEEVEEPKETVNKTVPEMETRAKKDAGIDRKTKEPAKAAAYAPSASAYKASDAHQGCLFATAGAEKQFAEALAAEDLNIAFTVILLTDANGGVTGVVWPEGKSPSPEQRKKIEKTLRKFAFDCKGNSSCTCTLGYKPKQ